MARSRKRSPVVAVTTAVSEKDDKQRASRHRSRHVRAELHQFASGLAAELALGADPPRSGSCTFAKDGKSWVPSDARERLASRLRK